MENLSDHLRPLIPGVVAPKRGPRPINDVAFTPAERQRRRRAPVKAEKLRCIAVMDFETDPFDSETQAEIQPFTAEIYSDQFAPIVIWEMCFERFIAQVYDAILSLPDSYTLYCHNGGKFDYMFLVSKLRGLVKFKGRAIMSCRIGNHELRDSLHILPEKLAAWKKDHFDYDKMKKTNRYKFKKEILKYQHADCVYLFDIVKSFTQEFGLKISIGQAAFSELKKSYKVCNVSASMDDYLRRYFFGGRVECVAGKGIFHSDRLPRPYRLYDVNSMYPAVMANYQHPTSNEYLTRKGPPSEDTVFIDITCKSYGAFVSRSPMPGHETPGPVLHGERQRFHTTIHEYKIAKKYGLIEDEDIHWCVDNLSCSSFFKFILPMYERRQLVKKQLEMLRVAGLDDTTEYEELHKQDLFLKYLLNNSYGKFAQNPRKYKDYCYTDLHEKPDAEWFEFITEDTDPEIVHAASFPVERSEQWGFAVWERPAPGKRFNNVGTAASITGAARAVLLEALQSAHDPIYCDTDSIICRDLPGAEIDVSKLGAWKIEQTFDSVIVAGKKLYACKVAGFPDGHAKRDKVRCKGAPGMTYDKMARTLEDEIITLVNFAPTIDKIGGQRYQTRRIRATAPSYPSAIRDRRLRA